MANVSIGGNVTDSVMVFGNNNYVVKIGDVNGGVVNIIKPSDKPKVSARPAPVMLKPRAFPSLLDRTDEAETIKKAAELSVPVSVWGKQGIGKTSFIRHLAHTLPTNRYPNGVIYLSVSSLGYEDLLQALFDAFFESDSSYKPTTAEILHGLQKISALIFLDDLQVGRDETISILNAAPSSTFILISAERSFWGEGEAVQIQGLPVGDWCGCSKRNYPVRLKRMKRSRCRRFANCCRGIRSTFCNQHPSRAKAENPLKRSSMK